MSKIAVIYWSMSGNTEAMANAIAEGAESAGAEVDVKQAREIRVDQAREYAKLALGCPAMGAEVLAESEFEPFFTQLEGRLGGKKVALFVNGCFWHRCPHCNLSLPKSNVEYWVVKFERNVERDERSRATLEELGWTVHGIWAGQPKDKTHSDKIRRE